MSVFGEADLAELDRLVLSRADEVVCMREIAAQTQPNPMSIGLRHDVDNTLDPCVQLARWEADRGYRATYFVLHHAPYWADEYALRTTLDTIADLGHEIGLHANGLAVALQTGVDQHTILWDALERLRGFGHQVVGVAAHGDPLCHAARFVNDEQFSECRRPEMGEPDRVLSHGNVQVRIQPRPLADFGLEYDSYRVGRRALYLSDSGGQWNTPVADVAEAFPAADGQLHMLVHNCWWTGAFQAVAA